MSYRDPLHDEGPSAEDIERFSDDTAYCPHCGDEIWDEAVYCPNCDEPVAGETISRPPTEQWFRQRWLLLVVIIALLAFVLTFVF